MRTPDEIQAANPADDLLTREEIAVEEGPPECADCGAAICNDCGGCSETNPIEREPCHAGPCVCPVWRRVLPRTPDDDAADALFDAGEDD